MDCTARLQTHWNSGQQCAREAHHIVNGSALCWQHAQMARDDGRHWEMEERGLMEIARLAPPYPGPSRSLRLRNMLAERVRWIRDGIGCPVCGRYERRGGTLVVHPITLQRYYLYLCGRRGCRDRVVRWQGAAEARRHRAVTDYEHEHRLIEPFTLVEGMPPQYAGVSRATLRAFLDSGYEAATVGGGSAATLNGSIRSLGFAGSVYAEVRSGSAVLRRVPQVTDQAS